MLPKDIVDKVRRIEITTNRLVTDVFAGAYHSVFKGRGMEFDEVREYQLGDDIRAIDWNVTARTGTAHIKKYVEERELTLMILVDASRSVHFASSGQMKNKIAAEIAAVLAFAAIRNNDKVGLIMFTDQVELFIPPKKGRSHVLRVIREILYFEAKGKGTDLAGALKYMTQVLNRKSVAFVISDFFFASHSQVQTEAYKTMRLANKYHDLIAITLNDPREAELPSCGLVDLTYAETGQRVLVDTADENIRNRYREKALAHLRGRQRLFDGMGLDHIDVATDVPYAKSLVAFFARRQGRRG